MAADAKLPLPLRIGLHVVTNGRVGNTFNQSQAKQLQWNAERDIAIAHSCNKVRLLEFAVWRVRAALNGEQAVNTTITGAVCVEFEPRLAECAVRSFEIGNSIGPAQPMSNHICRIHRRRAASDGGLGVADKALVGIEDRPHACRVDQIQR